MTVPTLILIGELDDWTPATECRNLAEGRDDWGISREKGEGIPIEITVYPGAYHDFDVPNFATPVKMLGHHLEFNEAARDQSIDAVRKFLYATIGGKEENNRDHQSCRLRCLWHALRRPVGGRCHRGCVFPAMATSSPRTWRIKQLEYSLAALADAALSGFLPEVTRDWLAYTLDSLGLQYDDDTFARIIDKYLHLDLYPDALTALSAMKDRKLAILSNGSPGMLDALVRNSGLDRVLDAVISVDEKRLSSPVPKPTC